MAEQEEQFFDTTYSSEASDESCEETTSTNDPETKLQITPPTKRKRIRCAYNDAWKKSYPWSKPYPAGRKHYGWCTYCSKSVNIKAGSNEFKKHSLTKAHKRNEKSILSSTSLTSLIN